MGEHVQQDQARWARRRAGAGVLVALAVAVTSVASPEPAAAEVVEGACSGTVTMADAVVIDTEVEGSEVVTIPAAGTVAWAGTTPVAEGSVAPVSGELRARHAVGWLELSRWTGEAVAGEATGVATYDVPRVVPRGSGPIPIELVLTIGEERCRIVGTVRLDGATLDPLSIVSSLITAALLAAVAFAGRADARGRGRPALGAAAGVAAGIAGAAALFGVGVVPLDSGSWWVLPALLGALGLALGAAAPFPGRRAGPTGPGRAASALPPGHLL